MPKKAWIVAVSMGYGHERAAYGLKELAQGGEYILANEYPGIPKSEREGWIRGRKGYETISRFKSTPLIGSYIFEIFDKLQEIPLFYPRRDLSEPNIQLKSVYRDIEKNGVGRHLVEKLSKHPLPFISTFFVPAFAAEVYNYPGDIYLVICDADMSRTWAPLNPKKSRIKYFAPNGRVVERLKLYGVPEERIYFTGFPLPKELIGGERGRIVKDNIAHRIFNLDPQKIFTKQNEATLHRHFGRHHFPTAQKHPLTLTFAVGGAGAQQSLGVEILESLREKISKHEIRLNLVAGIRRDVSRAFHEAVNTLKLHRELGTWIRVLATPSRHEYFAAFTHLLHDTDLLWTKPSELSFYTGLGIPIITAPPVGSQEEFNRVWLKMVGGGVTQNDPRYTHEWLFDWVKSGGLARMAWNGYIEAPTHGAYRIESIITGQPINLAKLPLIV